MATLTTAQVTIPSNLKKGYVPYNAYIAHELTLLRGNIYFDRADNLITIYFRLNKNPIVGYEADSTTAKCSSGRGNAKGGTAVIYDGTTYKSSLAPNYIITAIQGGSIIAFHRNGGVSNYCYYYKPSGILSFSFYGMDDPNRDLPAVTIEVPPTGDIVLDVGCYVETTRHPQDDISNIYGNLVITESRDVPDPEPPSPSDPIMQHAVYTKVDGKWIMVM